MSPGALIQVMTWRRIGDKPLPEPMMIMCIRSVLTWIQYSHITLSSLWSVSLAAPDLSHYSTQSYRFNKISLMRCVINVFWISRYSIFQPSVYFVAVEWFGKGMLPWHFPLMKLLIQYPKWCIRVICNNQLYFCWDPFYSELTNDFGQNKLIVFFSS